MLNIFGWEQHKQRKSVLSFAKRLLCHQSLTTHSSKEFFFQFAIFFLFLILQKHVLGVTNLSPPIHQSINILVVFLVSQNIPFLFLKKKCCRQCLTFHPSEQCFFAICLLFFYNLPFIFSFSILQKKMLSPMQCLTSHPSEQ